MNNDYSNLSNLFVIDVNVPVDGLPKEVSDCVELVKVLEQKQRIIKKLQCLRHELKDVKTRLDGKIEITHLKNYSL